MDFDKSYISEFVLYKVDPATWANDSVVDGLVSATVNKDCTDETPLMETVTMSIDRDLNETFESGWYRLEMLATQGNDFRQYPIVTTYLTSSSGVIDRGVDNLTVDGVSVLKPLSDRLMIPGEFIPKGAKGLDYLTEMLAKTTPAPVRVEGSFYLNNHYVFDPGTSYLQAMWDILNAANWCVQISGDGTITIKAVPETTVFSLDRDALGMVSPGIDYTLDLSAIPNRYFAIDALGSAMVVNNDKNSPVSYANKGWYVDVYDSDPMCVNGESLENYAKRQLVISSTVMKTFGYTREFVPNLRPFDLVAGSLPEYGFEGEMRVLSQQLTCTRGITTVEKVGLEVKEWEG